MMEKLIDRLYRTRSQAKEGVALGLLALSGAMGPEWWPLIHQYHLSGLAFDPARRLSMRISEAYRHPDPKIQSFVAEHLADTKYLKKIL